MLDFVMDIFGVMVFSIELGIVIEWARQSTVISIKKFYNLLY